MRCRARRGRPWIPLERLLKASLLMTLYMVSSERLLCEQLDYNLMFRWFLDLELDQPQFRALDVLAQSARGGGEEARALGCSPTEHFTVDGTLVEA